LIEAIIGYAKQRDIRRLHLLCSAEREEANKLYRSLGFEKREMNPYQLKVP
jgi:ribosomal protein S18 acetylase RimI-like enzyme